jgi:PIN domain
LLAALQEQQDYIFVTEQVVKEVQRRKVEVAVGFLAEQFKKLQLRQFAVPDHLFGETGDKVKHIRNQFQNIQNKIKATNDELINLTYELLNQITWSKDEVSSALAGIFAKVTPHNEAELTRARIRKELGNAPGKKADPLGDQLSWEQILSHCRHKTRLWLITKDGDYVTEYEGKVFLNAALYKELTELRQPPPEVFCFNNIPDGIKHFAETTKIKAEALPTPEETEQIKKEQESLPPFSWSIPAGTFSTAEAISAIVSAIQTTRPKGNQENTEPRWSLHWNINSGGLDRSNQ